MRKTEDGRNELWTEKRERRRERSSTTIDYHRLPHLYIKLSTPAPSVAETVAQKPGCLVTADAAQNKSVIDGAAPLSLEIDGCQ